jgi:hypothetical protein
MTREEKCKYAKQSGYKYDVNTGKVYGIKGKEITRRHKGYIAINLRVGEKNKTLLAHQYAWWLCFNELVEELDHINGVRDDNRIINLRSVTPQQNQWNRKTAKGYYFNKNESKFRAKIYLDSKEIHLGYYNTEEEAKQAYLNAKEKYHII